MGQAATAALSVGIVVSTFAATAAAASVPPRVDDRFRLREDRLEAPAIPGRALGGRPEGERRIVSTRTTINKGGGGEYVAIAGQRAEGSCNLPEILMEAIRVGAPLCGNLSGRQRLPLFDRNVFPAKALPPTFLQLQPPYGRLGYAVDEITSPEEVKTVVDALATRSQDQNPLLDPVPARFDATVELMDSPLASPKIRRWLVENLISTSGAAPQANVRDPDGRPATLLEIPDSSHAGVIRLVVGGENLSYDLTEAAETRSRLYYDSSTWDILAREDALVSSTLSELQPFAETSAPKPAVYFSTTYGPVKTVHRYRFVQYRVPCQKLAEAEPDDNFCVEVGGPGGYEISLKLKRP